MHTKFFIGRVGAVVLLGGMLYGGAALAQGEGTAPPSLPQPTPGQPGYVDPSNSQPAPRHPSDAKTRKRHKTTTNKSDTNDTNDTNTYRGPSDQNVSPNTGPNAGVPGSNGATPGNGTTPGGGTTPVPQR